MELLARVPQIPERKSEQTPARLARKVGPIFGVPFQARSWLGDYSRVTLNEVMRGAPKDLPDRDLTPIANATAARYGPDTKAAFILTGANVLFGPVEGALATALRELPLDDPDLLVGAYAYAVLEVLRSEPILLQAAVQAQAVQRALTALAIPFRKVSVDGLAEHEWGTTKATYHDHESPTTVDLIETLAQVLATRVAPRLRSIDVDAFRATVAIATTATLLDLSKSQLDASMRARQTPAGRRADLLIDVEARIRRLARSLNPHLEQTSFPDGPGDAPATTLDQIERLPPVEPADEELVSRARLTLRAGLLVTHRALFDDPRPLLRQRRARLLAAHADQVAEVVGTDHPEHRVARLRAVTARLDAAAAGSPDLAAEGTRLLAEGWRLIEQLRDDVDRDRHGLGVLYPAVEEHLVVLNRVRRLQAGRPVEGLPGVAELTGRTAALWTSHLDRLALFFDPDDPDSAEGYALRLVNATAFLVDECSPAELRLTCVPLLCRPVLGIVANQARPGRGGDQPGRGELESAVRALVEAATARPGQEPALASQVIDLANRLAQPRSPR